MAPAAGFEPASTSLEERRLVPLGHASNSNNSGIDEIRTRVILIDNQVPEPLGHDPNSSAIHNGANVRTRTCIARLSTACSDRLSYIGIQRTGSGRRARTFTLRFQRPACCQLHHPGTSTNGETRTRDLLVHNQTLYPAKLRSQATMAGMERLELSKPGLKNLLLDRFAFIPVSVRQTSVCRWFPTGSIQ